MLQYEKISFVEGIDVKKASSSKECLLCHYWYIKDIYSGINEMWYKSLWKEFDQWKDIDQKYYFSYYYDVNVNKYGGKYRTSPRF